MAAAPVVAWPILANAEDGRQTSFAEALGAGGHEVEHLLSALVDGRPPPPHMDVEELTRSTPTGRLNLPVTVVPLTAAVEAVDTIDKAWLKEVDQARSSPRGGLVAAGREMHLEAALNVAMLVATQCITPTPDDVNSYVASGARLWLLGAAVAWALTGTNSCPFLAWAELVVHGFWPVGPSRNQLVVCEPAAASAEGNLLR